MKLKLPKIVLSGALSLISVTVTAHAATIAWSASAATVSGAFGENLDSGLFNTSGTLVQANNFGGSATTFDGISFAANTSPFSLTFDGFHENSPLSDTGAYNNTGSATIGLTGLTVGAVYRIQALVYDGRSGSSGRTVSFDSTNLGQYANGVFNVTYGSGLLATGTFTADATTQSFTTEIFNPSSASAGSQLNAMTVYQTAVPEPSTALLGALGILGLLRRRRA